MQDVKGLDATKEATAKLAKAAREFANLTNEYRELEDDIRLLNTRLEVMSERRKMLFSMLCNKRTALHERAMDIVSLEANEQSK